jgi:hypothetical protein
MSDFEILIRVQVTFVPYKKGSRKNEKSHEPFLGLVPDGGTSWKDFGNEKGVTHVAYPRIAFIPIRPISMAASSIPMAEVYSLGKCFGKPFRLETGKEIPWLSYARNLATRDMSALYYWFNGERRPAEASSWCSAVTGNMYDQCMQTGGHVEVSSSPLPNRTSTYKPSCKKLTHTCADNVRTDILHAEFTRVRRRK